MIVNSQDFMLVPGSNRSIAAIALVSVSCTRSSALVDSRHIVRAKARSAGMRLTISGSGLPELVLFTRAGSAMSIPFPEHVDSCQFGTAPDERTLAFCHDSWACTEPSDA